jgi:hypothetical protein
MTLHAENRSDNSGERYRHPPAVMDDIHQKRLMRGSD